MKLSRKPLSSQKSKNSIFVLLKMQPKIRKISIENPPKLFCLADSLKCIWVYQYPDQVPDLRDGRGLPSARGPAGASL